MTVLEFIFGISALLIAFITIIGICGLKFNSLKLEEENEQLKEEIAKLRARKSKEVKKDVK